MGPVSTPYFASCSLKSSSVRSVTCSSSSRGLSVFLVAFCGEKKRSDSAQGCTFDRIINPRKKPHTYSSRATFVGYHRGRQVLVAGESVGGRVLLAVLRGQVLQIQLNVHLFLVLSAGKRHVIGYELTLQLVLRQNSRIVEKFCHGKVEKDDAELFSASGSSVK